jgi:hypothetical protein
MMQQLRINNAVVAKVRFGGVRMLCRMQRSATRGVAGTVTVWAVGVMVYNI